MPECSKTHLQQSTISKFSGGGPPDPRFKERGGKGKGGKGKGGEGREERGREPTSKGTGGEEMGKKGKGRGEGRGGKGEEGKGKGNICRTNVKLLPAPLFLTVRGAAVRSIGFCYARKKVLR